MTWDPSRTPDPDPCWKGAGLKPVSALWEWLGCVAYPPPHALTKGASRKSFCSILGTISSMRMANFVPWFCLVTSRFAPFLRPLENARNAFKKCPGVFWELGSFHGNVNTTRSWVWLKVPPSIVATVPGPTASRPQRARRAQVYSSYF